MFISKKTIYAISVMIDISQNAHDRLVSAKELADRHEVMPRFFEIMLKNLASAGLIRGQRGPRGGYQLARDTDNIAISDIVRAVSMDKDDEFLLPKATQAQLMPYMQQTNNFILRKLSETSLADLLQPNSRSHSPQAMAS